MRDYTFVLRNATAVRSIILVALLLLAGCAGLEERACEQREIENRNVKPITTYRLAAPPPGQAQPRNLPAGSVPLVSTYKLSFRPGFTKPCSGTVLYKDVVIQRGPGDDLVLNEIREFYAEDGTLITSNSQDVTAQIKQSGYYAATTPLPIPKKAPPGKYRIVSRLMYERHGSGRPAIQIARGEAALYIVPRE